MTPAEATPVGIAVIGCGTISHEYLRNLLDAPEVKVVACADIDSDRAADAATRYRVPFCADVPTVLAHPEVELVVNLTVPTAHVPVALAAVRAGRHVYNEKPFALNPPDAATLLAEARLAGVRVGGAPDTFLGPGWQTAYRTIGRGDIGVPLSAVVLMQGPGPQRWHHNPEFFFQPGAGPLFDMGPYYLTALAALFGPVTRVAATARQAYAERTIGAGPRAGQRFRVETPTHVAALLEYVGGQVANAVFSFDSPLARQDFVEITGTEATLGAPNPNGFAGPVRIRRIGQPDWTPIPAPEPRSSRGLGVRDMADAIRTGRPHRASAELAAHIVDVMTAIQDSARQGTFLPVRSAFTPPEPVPDEQVAIR